jgi:hypothetical protein
MLDLEWRSVELLPNLGFVVLMGEALYAHPKKSVILMVETAAIVPTGDA